MWLFATEEFQHCCSALNRKVYSDSEVLVSSAAEVSKCLVDILQTDVFGDEQIQVRIVPLHVPLWAWSCALRKGCQQEEDIT